MSSDEPEKIVDNGVGNGVEDKHDENGVEAKHDENV